MKNMRVVKSTLTPYLAIVRVSYLEHSYVPTQKAGNIKNLLIWFEHIYA